MRKIPIDVTNKPYEGSPYADILIEGREIETKTTLHFFELIDLREKLWKIISLIADANPNLAKEAKILTSDELKKLMKQDYPC